MKLRLLRGLLVAWGAAVGCLIAFAAPAVATTWVAQNPPLSGLNPAAGVQPSTLLEKDSCAAVGWCVAVGTYTDVGGSHQGLIETLSGGRFIATTAPLAGLNPAAGPNPKVFMSDVSCPVTGWCVADGQYADASGTMHLFAEMLSNGSWHATTLPLTGLNPAADASALPGVSSMTCPAEGACVIVGAYTANSVSQPLTERLAGGGWQAQTAPVDTLSPAGSMGQLFDVSCSSSGACTAVGNTDGGQGDLVEKLSGGSWVASSPSLAGLTPKAAGGGSLSNVSCPSSGTCTAVGSYEDQTGAFQGLIVTGNSTTDVDLSKIKPPPFSNPLFSFQGVACFSTCIAVGAYTYPSGGFTGRQLTVTTTGGPRGPTTTAASLSGLKPAPSSPAGVGLNAASCADASDCVGVGQYAEANGDDDAILETIAGTASSAAAPSLGGLNPAPGSNPDATLTGVSCPAAGACLAVGNWIDSSLTYHAIVVIPTRRRCQCHSPPALLPPTAKRRQPPRRR